MKTFDILAGRDVVVVHKEFDHGVEADRFAFPFGHEILRRAVLYF
jgi:hypothetical protein